jgi:8-oxo-dGTP pyrophosphatase MutT (NUDIX family)
VTATPPVFPVSVKGVVFVGDRVALLKNERQEWELPGGRQEAGEAPAACVVREIREELGRRHGFFRAGDCKARVLCSASWGRR